MVDKNLSAQENARRILNRKYGTGNWKTGPNSEYNKITKWINRDFNIGVLVPVEKGYSYIAFNGDLIISDPTFSEFSWINKIYFQRYD